MSASSQQGRKYYIHDTTRHCVGNCMVWWRKGHHGYTCDVRDAHEFDVTELPTYLHGETDLVAYPAEHINQHVKHHADMQSIDRALGIKRVPQQVSE